MHRRAAVAQLGCRAVRLMSKGTMKRFVLGLVLLALAAPAWSARKITVTELTELLRSFEQEKKSDLEAATALKQVELTEQLTRTAMNSLVGHGNGPLSTEQIYVLEARSANLAPPPSDLPATPAPDLAAQKSILTKTETYISRTYDQLPTLTATRTTLRFQDNLVALAASSGVGSGAKEAVTSSGFSNPDSYVRYINSTASLVTSEHGTEKKPPEKDQTRWGANGMTAIQEPTPGLGIIFREAQAAGSFQWLRWELVNGKPAAVFSFSVPKQKSKLAVNVCCFPNINQAGKAIFYTASTAAALGGPGASGGGVAGNFQTHTEWHEFKTTAPYHGRLFIDPDSGVVVRMIVEAELKPGEVVHQLDTRVDYAAVKAGQGTFVVPVKTVVNSVVVPNGESGAGGYSTRSILLTSAYSEYRPGLAKP
jgi:hypothetical protein